MTHSVRNIFYIFFLFFLFPVTYVHATPPSFLEMETEDDRLVRWDLTADSISSQSNSEVLEARGNVYLRRGDEYLKADFARYYTTTKWVYLNGNVRVRMGKDELTAAEAEFDLRSRVGWLKKGTIFIAGPHAYISGDKINKHWGDVYTFKQAKVTTCDGDTPAWSITADEAIVEIDGYARMRNSAIQIKDTPVAFTPFFLFPTKTSRQTGLLIPDFGRSTRKGFFYNQPFFWAINESSDLTINEEFMEKRGFMHGIEYRTRPTKDSMGWLRFDWMHDKITDRDGDIGPYRNQGLVRSNEERYWLRGMLDAKLPDPNWRFKADLDYVSDQDYLTEFKGGHSGFKRSQSDLFSFFNRELREKDQNRVSGALLTREWDRGGIALSGQYTQDPKFGHGNTLHREDATVQRVPQFDAFLHKGRIFPSFPLEIEASGQAAYMYRRNGTRGARYTVTPRVTLPLTSRYGSLIATTGIVHTIYNTEHPSRSSVTGSSKRRETEETKTVPEFDIAASTEFARVYSMNEPLPLAKESVGKSQLSALSHSIQPRLEYIYRPLVDQRDHPYYDGDDRLTPTTDLVYSVTNVLTTKRETVVLEKNSQGEMVPTNKTNYAELARLKIGQTFDHREASRDYDRDQYGRRPFGDVFAELSVAANEYVSLSTRNYWSPYMKDITRHESGTTINITSNANVYVGYDLRRKLDEYTRIQHSELRYLKLRSQISNLGPFSFTGGFSYDIEMPQNREIDLNLTYNDQCFAIIGRVFVEPQDETYQLLFVLTGLGD